MENFGGIQGWDGTSQLNRLAGLAITIFLHALVLMALLQCEPVRSAFTQVMPIMVSLIAPQPVVEKPQVLTEALPVGSKTLQPTPPEPRQLITAVSEASAPVLAPAPRPPEPVEAAPPQQPVAAVAPVPVIPPNFNADYLDNPAPAYPPLSRRLGEQGSVMLRVLVNASGSPENIELKSSSGSSRLDNAALDVVKRWRFVPARQGNQPVAAWVLIPITFTLKG